MKPNLNGIRLDDLLKEYFKEDILTNKENVQKYKNELEEFWQEILNQNEGTYVYKYLQKCVENKDKLYQDIKRHYNKDAETLKLEFLNACKGINNLPSVIKLEAKDNSLELGKAEEIIRIPVFASRITLNPHGFDKKTLCGKLFILLLCYVNNVDYPKSSEELSELYYNNNLLVDDVSSMVLCKNITAYTSKIESIEDGKKVSNQVKHEGLEGFNKYNEPIFLTLYNLSNLGFVSPCGKYKDVVVMENPAVFMEVMQRCKAKDFPLVCTYGQVKLAGIMLLDLLAKQNYRLHYSGDLDPEGVQIADRLKTRYGERLDFLGFDRDTYYKNISDVELPEERIRKLDNVKSGDLTEICEAIRENRRAGYEERNIDYIVSFIEDFL